MERLNGSNVFFSCNFARCASRPILQQQWVKYLDLLRFKACLSAIWYNWCCQLSSSSVKTLNMSDTKSKQTGNEIQTQIDFYALTWQKRWLFYRPFQMYRAFRVKLIKCKNFEYEWYYKQANWVMTDSTKPFSQSQRVCFFFLSLSDKQSHYI